MLLVLVGMAAMAAAVVLGLVVGVALAVLWT